MRVLGLDLGARRIGVAVSDSAGAVATPYSVFERSGRRDRDHREVARMVREVGAGRVVVGLPLSLGGEAGPAARSALEEVTELRRILPVEVEAHDERLTTVSATRTLREAGASRSARRRSVDQVAAAVMLQSWLDRARP